MATNYQVFSAFANGDMEVNTSRSLTSLLDVKTGFLTLFSYELPIGYWFDGECIIENHSATGLGMESVTTSKHIGQARNALTRSNVSYICIGKESSPHKYWMYYQQILRLYWTGQISWRVSSDRRRDILFKAKCDNMRPELLALVKKSRAFNKRRGVVPPKFR